jgi:hypothetical protein
MTYVYLGLPVLLYISPFSFSFWRRTRTCSSTGWRTTPAPTASKLAIVTSASVTGVTSSCRTTTTTTEAETSSHFYFFIIKLFMNLILLCFRNNTFNCTILPYKSNNITVANKFKDDKLFLVIHKLSWAQSYLKYAKNFLQHWHLPWFVSILAQCILLKLLVWWVLS